MIGLIPAAGRAERLHGLPKYLLPLPDGYLLENACHLMYTKHVTPLVVFSKANYEAARDHLTPAAGALILDDPTRTMVHTLLEARRHIANQNILMVMPDTYFTPQPDLVTEIDNMLSIADVVLAVWPFRETQRGTLGAVDLDGATVREVVDKNPFSPHQFFWGAMAWQPTFWAYMKPEQPHLGIAVNAAIADGLRVRAVFAAGEYYDCGTFDGYAELVRALTEDKINVS